MEHAAEFARTWADRLDEYCAVRMQELGIPAEQIGAGDPEHGIRWCCFNPYDLDGGNITTGITINTGVLDSGLLQGKAGATQWPRARLRDRIDAIIAHEWEEYRSGSHEAALKTAPATDLPITAGARRILQAMSP